MVDTGKQKEFSMQDQNVIGEQKKIVLDSMIHHYAPPI